MESPRFKLAAFLLGVAFFATEAGFSLTGIQNQLFGYSLLIVAAILLLTVAILFGGIDIRPITVNLSVPGNLRKWIGPHHTDSILVALMLITSPIVAVMALLFDSLTILRTWLVVLSAYAANAILREVVLPSFTHRRPSASQPDDRG